jgi:hypothetical protein
MTSPPQQSRAHEQARAPHEQADPGAALPGASPRPPRWRATTVAVALTTVLLLLVVASAALSGPWVVTEPDPVPVTTAPVDPMTAPPTETPPPDDTLEQPEDEGDGASTVLATVLGLALLAALVFWARKVITRRLLPWLAGRRLPEPVPADPATTVVSVSPVAELEEAAAQAAARLRSSADPTDDVVAAWVALESAAEASGTERRPAQTPTEFTVEVLGTTPASPAAVQTLLRLYHRARFTEHPITTAEGAEAATALERLVVDLRSTEGGDR